MKRIILVLFFLFVPAQSFAHPGGTDSFGCHTDHSTHYCHKKQRDPVNQMISLEGWKRIVEIFQEFEEIKDITINL